MFKGKAVVREGQTRVMLPSSIRLGMTLAGLVAVIVAMAAWSSPGTAASITGAATSAAKKVPTKLPASSKQCREDKAAGKMTYASPFAFDASAGIIDVFEAAHLGYFKDLCLNVTIEGTATNADALVSGGAAQASSASDASTIMGYIAGGSRIVGVETTATYNPQSMILNSKYTSLKGMEGKTFGYYQAIPPMNLAMFKAAKVPINTIHFVSLTDHNPEIIESLVDGFGAFLGSQDLILKAEKVPFTEITAGSLGLKGTTSVMYMNRPFVQKHPVAAENFIRADLKALGYCFSDKAACIQNLANVATANNEGAAYGVAEDTPVWDYSAKLLKANETKPLGTFTTALWKPEYRLTKEFSTEANHLSGIDDTVKFPAITRMMDTTLVANVYTSKGKLIWP